MDKDTSQGRHNEVWVIGDPIELDYFLNFVESRLERDDKSNDRNEMRGILQLGEDDLFAIKLTRKTKEEFDKENKTTLQPDGLIVYAKDKNFALEEEFALYENFESWGNVKVLAFLEPFVCPGDIPCISKYLGDKINEKHLRRFMKGLPGSKKEYIVYKEAFTFS